MNEKTLKQFELLLNLIDDKKCKDVVVNTIDKFTELYSPIVIKDSSSKYLSIIKIMRSIVVETNIGNIQSADFIVPHDYNKFINDKTYRESILNQCNWTNDAEIFFSYITPPVRYRKTTPILSANLSSLVANINNYVKYFEYLLQNRTQDNIEYISLFENNEIVNVNLIKKEKIDTQKRLSKTLDKALRKVILNEIIQKEVVNKIEEFKLDLNKNILDLMKIVKVNQIDDYNWLNGKHRLGHNQEFSEKRIQAVNAYPILWNLFKQNNPIISSAIENGHPLLPVISEVTKVQENIIKKMNKINPDLFGLPYAASEKSLTDIIFKLENINLVSTPKTKEGWENFIAMTSIFSELEERIYLPKSESNRMISSMSNKLDDFPKEKLNAIQNLAVDMLSNLEENLFLPIALHLEKPTLSKVNIFIKLFANKNFEQFLEAIEYWNNNQQRISRNLTTNFPKDKYHKFSLKWIPLNYNKKRKEEFVENNLEENWDLNYDDLVITPLIDSEMLQDEHKRMSHCVNTYTSRCMYDGSHVFSVRNKLNKSLATFQIEQKELFELIQNNIDITGIDVDYNPPSVMQIQGPLNNKVDEKIRKIIWDFIYDMVTKKIKIDIDYILLENESRIKKYKPMHNIERNRVIDYNNCIYNPSFEAVNEAWKLYKNLIPKSVYKAGINNEYLFTDLLDEQTLLSENIKRNNKMMENKLELMQKLVF
jgi:hypothetical protein